VVDAIAFKKLDERILDFVKNKAKLSNSKVINLTHEQIANELGSARVVVSRLLKQLESEGVVELGRNKITLCN
jgi:CRP/FNR family transcriptional regulator